MQVEIIVKVDGQVVGTHKEQVSGTLEQMEEKVIALSRRVGNQTLQASVDAMGTQRPPFRRRAGACGTGATGSVR